MSHYSKIFNKVPVEIPNRSGFDCSHENLFTAPVGTLIPAMVDPVIPGDAVTLGVSSQIQLPPMATDFYGRIQAKFEAFFVPNRLLYGGWKDFITYQRGSSAVPGASLGQKADYLPYLTIGASNAGPGTLADYLGLKLAPGTGTMNVKNPLSFLAYHKIWNDWYRDSRIQKECFTRPTTTAPQTTIEVSSMPYISRCDGYAQGIGTAALADGVRIDSLRQRCWAKDYFTNATTSPQAGNESSLSFGITASDGTNTFNVNVAAGQNTLTANGNPSQIAPVTGQFSIASLRAANALQLWLERNNIAGSRYGDRIKAQFGVYPSDAITDRCLYLGSKTVDVYNKSVYQNSPSSSTGQVSTQNPFNSQGAKYANPIGVGDGSLIDKFTANEHGFVFVMFSLVPQAYYSTGRRRYLNYSSATDFPWPLLAGVGDQAILATELVNYDIPSNIQTFGYTQRYSECKYMDDEVHGLLRDGQSLDSFCLQRGFSSVPILGSAFLEIPRNYLDQVGAVASSVSDYGCWVDSYFAYKKSSTLPAYSIPSLGDMHDVHTEVIDNGGKRL